MITRFLLDTQARQRQRATPSTGITRAWLGIYPGQTGSLTRGEGLEVQAPGTLEARLAGNSRQRPSLRPRPHPYLCPKDLPGNMLPARFTTLDPMPDVASPSPPTSVDLRPPDGPPPTTGRSRSTSTDPPAVGSAAGPPVAELAPPLPAPPPPVKKRSQKFTRSRDGCLACRKIKQRCDATKPVCVRCVISNKEVSPPSSFSCQGP